MFFCCFDLMLINEQTGSEVPPARAMIVARYYHSSLHHTGPVTRALIASGPQAVSRVFHGTRREFPALSVRNANLFILLCE